MLNQFSFSQFQEQRGNSDVKFDLQTRSKKKNSVMTIILAMDKILPTIIYLLFINYISSKAQNIMNQNKFLEDLYQIKPMQKFSSINEFLKESENFNKNIRKAPPTSANWIKKSMEKDTLSTFLNFANSAYPILDFLPGIFTNKETSWICHRKEFVQIFYCYRYD